MNKEFVPYNEALELKELGFDEPCFVYWVFNNVEITFSTTDNRSGWSMIGFTNSQMSKKAGLCTAPTYSQAFRWFRDNHGLYQSIEFNERYGKWVSRWCHINGSMGAISTHIKYEDAEVACLNKFIEFIKTKQ